MERFYRIAGMIGIALLLTYVVALACYRFAHPELTETQLFLRIPDAIGFGNASR